MMCCCMIALAAVDSSDRNHMSQQPTIPTGFPHLHSLSFKYSAHGINCGEAWNLSLSTLTDSCPPTHEVCVCHDSICLSPHPPLPTQPANRRVKSGGPGGVYAPPLVRSSHSTPEGRGGPLVPGLGIWTHIQGVGHLSRYRSLLAARPRHRSCHPPR